MNAGFSRTRKPLEFYTKCYNQPLSDGENPTKLARRQLGEVELLDARVDVYLNQDCLSLYGAFTLRGTEAASLWSHVALYRSNTESVAYPHPNRRK